MTFDRATAWVNLIVSAGGSVGCAILAALFAEFSVEMAMVLAVLALVLSGLAVLSVRMLAGR